MKVKKESENVGLKLNIQKTKIMASGPITFLHIDGKQSKQWFNLFLGSPKSLQMLISAMKLLKLLLGGKVMANLGSILKSKNIFFFFLVNKCPPSQGCGFSTSHVWM